MAGLVHYLITFGNTFIYKTSETFKQATMILTI